MTIGGRRSLRNSAQVLKSLGPAKREAALLMQRSLSGPDVIAALIDENLDSAEIARTARKVLSGDATAKERFSTFDTKSLQSLCRLLCLVGDDEAFDNGLDVLLAMDVAPETRNLKPYYQRLRIESLVFRRRFTEAADYLRRAETTPAQKSRYRLGIHNPFRDGNSQAIPVTEWLKLFNDYVNPGSALNTIGLNPALGDFPFDQLWSAPESTVEGPLVTVVMSSYRRDDTILGAVYSILNQTWKSLELLIIDDDSGPEYQQIYERLESLDPRIRVVRQRVNGGTYLIRNRAITLSRGDFITFQDSDDWSHPQRIERQVTALLADRSMVATQSYCIRTDDYLDPVQVGYPKALRRNESSLMFRAEVVRRVGFFHYTRKGGDSEFRLRLEGAYGRPTPLIGEDPLALVRLTPGSLSRNEFAPGFRHPSRLIYSQGFDLVHARARANDSFYRPLAEYEDPFLPARFRPRSTDLLREELDVVVVADLRTCAEIVAPMIHTITRLNDAGLRVGIAHATGLYLSDLSVNRIEHEMSAIFVDGRAEPVLFGENRKAKSVLTMDARLLQQLPWGAGKWEVDRVVVPRTGSLSDNNQYDETTVAFNCLRLFGRRPEWLNVSGDDSLAPDELLEMVIEATEAKRAKPRRVELSSHVSASVGGRFDSGTWRVELRPSADSDSEMVSVVRQQFSHLPVAVAAVPGGPWCATIGWPSYGGGEFPGVEEIADGLLHSWQLGSGDFDEYYGEIGGDCLVVRCDGNEFAIRSPTRTVSASLNGNSVAVESSRFVLTTDVSEGNRSETIVQMNGGTFRNPIDTVVRYDGTALEEYQQLIDWEVGSNPELLPDLILSDDFDSAVWLGLLRDQIDKYKLSVVFAGSRVARFLDRHMVPYTIASSRHKVPRVLRQSEVHSEVDHCNVPTTVGASVRARTLGYVVSSTMTSRQILEVLWPGLSEAVESPEIRRDAQREAAKLETNRPSSLLTDGIQDARDVYSLDLSRRRVHRIGIAADLSLNESFSLSGEFIRGKSDRLVVTVAAERIPEASGYPKASRHPKMFPDHSLVAVDTTFIEQPALEFGWMFGSPGDDLARRWSMLVRQLRMRLGCTDVVVRGEGRAGLPAVMIASYLPDVTVLVEDPETYAGESDPDSMARLSELVGTFEGGADEFLRRYRGRLDLRWILGASSSNLKVVLTGVRDIQRSGVVHAFDEANCDVVVYPNSATDWLQTTAGGRGRSSALPIRERRTVT